MAMLIDQLKMRERGNDTTKSPRLGVGPRAAATRT